MLGGRYEVGELIGRGGMAEVHLGHDTRLGRPVAIKMLRSDLARDATFLSRFRREAQSAAGLNHASIVAVYDSGEDKITDAGGATVPVPYIVMEYVDGKTLREVLNERAPLEATEAARITEGILDALAYSHRMGIVHRDIKPANVMIGRHGEIKVMDFGIARAVADTNATMTQTQAVIGTAQYLSPEQAQGQHVDARSDLYSTGCLLFELLTGRPPFQADSPVAIAYQHVGQQPPRPSSLNPDIPAAFDAVVLHALAKDREARYQDATAFRADLQAARLGRPISDAARGTAAAAGADATVALAPASAAAATTVLPAGAGYAGQPAGGGNGNTATLPAVGHDPDDEPKKRRGFMYVLLVAAVLGALVVLGLFGRSLLDGGDKPQQQVAVPSVVNKPVETAQAEIRAAGLKPETNEVNSPKDVGTVVDQSPGGAEMVAPGSVVSLSVSIGPDTVDLPDLKGYDQEEAKTTLTNLGLKVAASNKEVDDSGVDKGKVVSTSPAAGETVAVGSTVTLSVSSGKVSVPDLQGRTRSDASDDLNAKSLNVKTVFKESSEPENTVIAQSIKAGTKVDEGTTVTITVAQPPPPTPTTTATPSTTTTTPPPTPSTTTTTPTGPASTPTTGQTP
ncbi:Stk1 family PASTA domain-containing Ser/Thr kinase [Knoellia sp. DB2414S]|uniref:non-specific serine/threonine protein kinase n=2 Tax=Knoellia koreensis TaxID=2730921 RepID=A0A849HNC9_9MICO|nr:Stk1 family PASTA domain-containing Ser/Thr kinase [Knoellia sp. DB2414S]